MLAGPTLEQDSVSAPPVAPPLAPLPVTLLTGFLGAGKTTLLRHVLTEAGAARICVVENEFGAANIDSEIVETLGPGLVRRLNGCICCAIRTDLVATFRDLAEVCRAQGVDRVIVETTGMAEPAELVPLFRPGGPVGPTFRLASVVTVADALHVAVDLMNSPIAQSQIAVADLLVLNKADLVSAAHLADASRALRATNPLARLHVTQHGHCPAELVLGDAPPALRVLPPDQPHSHGDLRTHLAVDPGPHDLRRLRAWLRSFHRAHRDDLLRCKGFVHASRGRRVLLQGVRERTVTEPFGRFPEGETPETRLVFIGLSLDPDTLDTCLERCRIPPVC